MSAPQPPRQSEIARRSFVGPVCGRTCAPAGNFSATLAATWSAWNYNHTSQWLGDVFRANYAREAAGFKALTVASDVGLSASELEGIGMSREEARAEGGVAP